MNFLIELKDKKMIEIVKFKNEDNIFIESRIVLKEDNLKRKVKKI
jgi:hypothetical protein